MSKKKEIGQDRGLTKKKKEENLRRRK